VGYTPRDEAPGIHHVTCRGNNRRPIFLTERDANDFLRRLTGTALKHGWKIYACCLMPNHYHSVIEIDERGLSRGFCELNTPRTRARSTTDTAGSTTFSDAATGAGGSTTTPGCSASAATSS
jgi:hypothetical protein